MIHGVGTNPAGDLLPASQLSRRSLVWQGGVEPPKRLEVDFGGHRRQLLHRTPEIVTSTAPNDATGSPPAPAPRRASCHKEARFYRRSGLRPLVSRSASRITPTKSQPDSPCLVVCSGTVSTYSGGHIPPPVPCAFKLAPAGHVASLVGARGFEPPTSCSQSRRATGLRYAPWCAPSPFLYSIREAGAPAHCCPRLTRSALTYLFTSSPHR